MILYFSATGNSLAIARAIAEHVGDMVLPLREAVQTDLFGDRSGILAKEACDIFQRGTVVELFLNVFSVIEGQVFMVAGNKIRHKDLLMPLSERNKDSPSREQCQGRAYLPGWRAPGDAPASRPYTEASRKGPEGHRQGQCARLNSTYAKVISTEHVESGI